MGLAIGLTPHGRIFLEESAESFPAVDDAVCRRIRAAFESGPAAALLHLATVELRTPLPPTLVFWRDFARSYLTRLCHTPGIERAGEPAAIDDDLSEIESLAASAPPMTGLEYLTESLLRGLWQDLDRSVREEVRAFQGGTQAWLRSRNPIWNLVGRVSFHLAENKRDPENPFAFLATYTGNVSKQARLQYQPLGRALEEYAGERNRNALLSLLSPVQRAAESSGLARELVDSGEIFHPLAWSPEQAYRFLKDVPIFESSGIIVRVPDWWKSGRPPRPSVSVTVGGSNKNKIGLDALLDFSVNLTLEGEPLTESEWDTILASTQGLVLLKGKWVEIDRDRLTEVLRHWKKLESARADGLSFAEGMRLLAGAGLDRKEEFLAEPATLEWSRITAGEWFSTVLAELRDPARLQTPDPVPGLNAELRPYQKTGVSWLWFMYRLGLGGCLADDMGLGKTIQVLSLLLMKRTAVAQGTARTIVVVPASLVANWKAEISSFAPSLSVFYAHPSETPSGVIDRVLEDPASGLQGIDVVVTTYGMLLRMPRLSQLAWDLAVLDEAQAIKNPSARQTRAAKDLKAGRRIVLTGTPVENRLSDLWSLFDFACPGLLGSAPAFKQYTKKLAAAGQSRYGSLRSLVRPYILRRLKTDRNIISDLPDKSEVRAFCALTKTQAALYQKSVEELAESLRNSEGIQRRGIVLSFILRFKQICNHPAQWLGTGDYSAAASGKFQRLRELCEEVASRQEKALIFTQFREVTGPLAHFLETVFRRPGLVLHGGTPVKERRTRIEDFQREDGPPFFVLSLKAGGTGLNLTEASHVIHFDRWWNPAVENQASDRAFRIGQHRNVLVHKFVCRGTVEDKIDALIEEKKGMAEELLAEGAEKLLTEMSDEELLSLVSLDIKSALTE